MPDQSIKDPELQAIEICLAALRPLPEAARARALAYLTERFAAEAIASQNGNGNSEGSAR